MYIDAGLGSAQRLDIWLSYDSGISALGKCDIMDTGSDIPNKNSAPGQRYWHKLGAKLPAEQPFNQHDQ